MDNATIAQRIREQAAQINNAVCHGTINAEQAKAAVAAMDALADEVCKDNLEQETKNEYKPGALAPGSDGPGVAYLNEDKPKAEGHPAG